ncbi:unnamed protein product [Dovyalis caffra]|uniref:Uncharacterized protein n=1 Tax=Dovyalis caffra TaxID=77055 RepID=A0AAV1RP43_9ROSI|nr:unnamed protein product [Dovyalis caffra]
MFDIPSHALSFVPPTFDPETWPLSVSFMGWRYPQRKWKEWVEKMAFFQESTWKKAGIRESTLNSTCEIHRNNDLVIGVAERCGYHDLVSPVTPSLACKPLSSKDNREGSEVPCVEHQENILELEQMIARIKAVESILELSP